MRGVALKALLTILKDVMFLLDLAGTQISVAISHLTWKELVYTVRTGLEKIFVSCEAKQHLQEKTPVLPYFQSILSFLPAENLRYQLSVPRGTSVHHSNLLHMCSMALNIVYTENYDLKLSMLRDFLCY